MLGIIEELFVLVYDVEDTFLAIFLSPKKSGEMLAQMI